MPHCLSLVPTTCTVITQEKPGYESWKTIGNFMPGMKKGYFHVRHEKRRFFTPGMKKGGFRARIFNGRLCLSQLKRRSGLLKAAGDLDRY